MMNCKCIEALTAEHKTILRISDVLEGMSNKAKTLVLKRLAKLGQKNASREEVRE